MVGDPVMEIGLGQDADRKDEHQQESYPFLYRRALSQYLSEYI
jgi:hypothetical protein